MLEYTTYLATHFISPSHPSVRSMVRMIFGASCRTESTYVHSRPETCDCGKWIVLPATKVLTTHDLDTTWRRIKIPRYSTLFLVRPPKDPH